MNGTGTFLFRIAARGVAGVGGPVFVLVLVLFVVLLAPLLVCGLVRGRGAGLVCSSGGAAGIGLI